MKMAQQVWSRMFLCFLLGVLGCKEVLPPTAETAYQGSCRQESERRIRVGTTFQIVGCIAQKGSLLGLQIKSLEERPTFPVKVEWKLSEQEDLLLGEFNHFPFNTGKFVWMPFHEELAPLPPFEREKPFVRVTVKGERVYFFMYSQEYMTHLSPLAPAL